MRVENFERLYVGSYHRDDAALLFAFEFRRAKHAERAEYFISERRKQSERDIVVTVLLYVSQQPADDAATYRETDYQAVGKRDLLAESLRDAHRAEYRYAHCRDETQTAVYYRKNHYIGQAAEKNDKACHDLCAASSYIFLFFLLRTHATASV